MLCIAVGVCLGAYSYAVDTIVYRLLDLTTKQMIDASSPIVALVLGTCCCWKASKYAGLSLKNPVSLAVYAQLSDESDSSCGDVWNEDDYIVANYKQKRSMSVRFGRWCSLLGIVTGLVLMVWGNADEPESKEEQSAQWLGMGLNASTLVSASFSKLLADYILNCVGWPVFKLIAIHGPFEFSLLVAATATTAYIGGNPGEPWTREVLMQAATYASVIMAASVPLGFISVTILQRTSVVTSMILSSVVMGIVIVIDFIGLDFVGSSKYDGLTMKVGSGITVFVVGMAGYCICAYIHERSVKKALKDDFAGSDSEVRNDLEGWIKVAIRENSEDGGEDDGVLLDDLLAVDTNALRNPHVNKLGEIV